MWVYRGDLEGLGGGKTVIPFRSAASALNPWICWTPESLGGVHELVDVARVA